MFDRTDLQLAGVTVEGRLWHSLRKADGTWSPFREVENQTGDVGLVLDVACDTGARLARQSPPPGTAPSDPQMDQFHLCAINGDGVLFHTIRDGVGAWVPFGNVGNAGGRGFQRVEVAVIDASLHVCAINQDRHLLHAVRFPDGTWTAFGDVEGQTGNIGEIVGVACTAGTGGLLVCAVTVDGHLWWTTRTSSGTWMPFLDVEVMLQSERGHIIDVGCVRHTRHTHICVVTYDGHLWHAAGELWTPANAPAHTDWTILRDVEGQAGERGNFARVALGVGNGRLEVCGVNTSGQLWIASRHRHTGAWTQFDDVEGQTNAGERGTFISVGLAGDSSFTN